MNSGTSGDVASAHQVLHPEDVSIADPLRIQRVNESSLGCHLVYPAP